MPGVRVGNSGEILQRRVLADEQEMVSQTRQKQTFKCRRKRGNSPNQEISKAVLLFKYVAQC